MDDIPLLRIIQITAILHESLTDDRIPEEVRSEYDSRVRDVLDRKDYVNVNHIK